MSEITVYEPRTLGPLADVAQQAQDYLEHSKAANTVKAYRSDWRHFTAWCDGHGLPSLPTAPETVALYLTDLAASCKPSTLQRRLSSISQAHQAAGLESPTKHRAVRAVWAGIRRTHGVAQQGKAPAIVDELKRMIATLPPTLQGRRDRALLLLGFAGAFRRSELVALDVADVQQTRSGLVVTLRRSKTDQEGTGRVIGIPYGSHPDTCPVRAYADWLAAAGIAEGAIFRPITRHGHLQPGRLSDKAVALIVKRTAEAAGLDPSRYAGHSLRAGLATSAALAGVPERVIANQTGHRSMAVLRRYIRPAELFGENAAASVGL